MRPAERQNMGKILEEDLLQGMEAEDWKISVDLQISVLPCRTRLLERQQKHLPPVEEGNQTVDGEAR
jgi:hypothetical protein